MAKTEKGVDPMQMEAKSFRRTNLSSRMSQNLFQHVEAKTTKKEERRASMEVKSSRRIRFWTQTLELRWEVNLVEKGRLWMKRRSSKFIPPHPLLQSPTAGNLTVREHGYVGCFL